MTRRSQREGREVRREWDKQSKTRSSTLTIQVNKGLKFETVEKQENKEKFDIESTVKRRDETEVRQGISVR